MNSVELQDTKLIHRNLLYFYTPEMKDKKEKETIPFTIASKRIKYVGVSLPKETKDLYSENYKKLMKEIEDNTNGKMYCILGRINIVKMIILFKAINLTQRRQEYTMEKRQSISDAGKTRQLHVAE